VIATIKGRELQSMSTSGLDIAKSVFQVHGVGAVGQMVVRLQLRRRHVLAFFQNCRHGPIA
jgi:transposase